jgi:hypothetical protein
MPNRSNGGNTGGELSLTAWCLAARSSFHGPSDNGSYRKRASGRSERKPCSSPRIFPRPASILSAHSTPRTFQGRHRSLEVHNDCSIKTAGFHLEEGLLLHFLAADDGFNLKLIHARHKLLRVRDASVLAMEPE